MTLRWLAPASMVLFPALLGACASAPPADAKPPTVYVNHFSRVLAPETYHAIVDSNFLREEFSGLQINEIEDDHGKWSGAYLYGERVYLEFFPADDTRNRVAGTGALVFGVEESGGADRLFETIVARMEAHVLHRLRMRRLQGREVPWFFETSVDWQDPRALVATWIMEYHPDFIGERYPDSTPAERGISRRQYLARQYKPDRLFKGMTEAVFAVDAVETAHLAELMKVMGWRVEADKLETRCHGPETLVRLVPMTESARGLVSVTLELNRPAAATNYRFGDASTLTILDDGTAEWDF